MKKSLRTIYVGREGQALKFEAINDVPKHMKVIFLVLGSYQLMSWPDGLSRTNFGQEVILSWAKVGPYNGWVVEKVIDKEEL